MAAAGGIAWPWPVLDFWFRELSYEAWFKKDKALDALIRERFLKLHEDVLREVPLETRSDPHAALAAVILFDQFPRNMFRDTPRAFATDSMALTIAASAVDGGLDQPLNPAERLFLYLPFEHSEVVHDQARSVVLISELGNKEWKRYAEAHKAIIDRFGRFPHRNSILGRHSTLEEESFLSEPGSSF